MKCPNCGFTFNHGYICPDCGVDIVIYQKTRNASIKLYNKGLELANNQNISGATYLLEQSILFDKNNYKAQNLLGLIYYEKGQLPNALKHWIISVSIYENSENLAHGYMETLQKNGRELEKNNDAVHFYNQALEYLNQGSEDLAVIQLKRALDYNSNFVDAHNLMALCCLEEKNFERAKYYVEKVLKMDKLNPFALRYAQELNLTVDSQTVKRDKRKSKQIKKTDSNPPLPTYNRQNQKLGGNYHFFSFLAGILCAAAVFLVLIMPAVSDAKDKSMEVLQAKITSAQDEIGITPEELKTLREELETLKKTNETYKTQIEEQTKLADLQNAASLITEGNMEEASAKISAIDPTGLSTADKETYDSVKETSYPKAARSLYNKGKSAFLNNHYSEAQGHLENALKYASGEAFVDDALYYLGNIAEDKQDMETAKKYYQRILDEFPSSNQITNARNQLTHLEQ